MMRRLLFYGIHLPWIVGANHIRHSINKPGSAQRKIDGCERGWRVCDRPRQPGGKLTKRVDGFDDSHSLDNLLFFPAHYR